MSKSSQLGAACGLLLGLTAITRRPSLAKWPVCLVALTDLVLTQSRTFWIAGLVAALATMWFYNRRLLRNASVVVLVGVAMLAPLTALLNTEAAATRLQSFARIYSFERLNGRVNIWDDVIASLKKRPLFGFGFTLGSSGLSSQLPGQPKDLSIEQLALISRQTIHSGYLQSVMDSGILGSALYLASIITAFWRILTRDIRRQYPEVLFALVFLTVSNAAENVIYSGSVFYSLLFWILAVFTMSLRKADSAFSEKRMMKSSEVVKNTIATSFPNLLR
jgi:O-antigen ligase